MTGFDRSFIRAFNRQDLAVQARCKVTADGAAVTPLPVDESEKLASRATIETPVSQPERSEAAAQDQGPLTWRFDVPAQFLSPGSGPHFLGTPVARIPKNPCGSAIEPKTMRTGAFTFPDEADTTLPPNQAQHTRDEPAIRTSAFTEPDRLALAEPDLAPGYTSMVGQKVGDPSLGGASIIRLDKAHPSTRDTEPAEVSAEVSPAAEGTIWSRPAFEVDQFFWPKVLQHMAEFAKSGMTRVADEVWNQVRSGRNVVSIAGCRSRQGRTTIALSLASRLAELNLRVLVIDANLIDPAVARTLGVAAHLGWDDVVASHLPIGEALIESMDDRLTIMPLRTARSHTIIQQGEAGFSLVVAEVRPRFDVVLVDLPATHARRIPPWVNREAGIDWAILVRSAGNIEDGLDQLVNQLVSLGVTPLGIVENEIQITSGNR